MQFEGCPSSKCEETLYVIPLFRHIKVDFQIGIPIILISTFSGLVVAQMARHPPAARMENFVMRGENVKAVLSDAAQTGSLLRKDLKSRAVSHVPQRYLFLNTIKYMGSISNDKGY